MLHRIATRNHTALPFNPNLLRYNYHLSSREINERLQASPTENGRLPRRPFHFQPRNTRITDLVALKAANAQHWARATPTRGREFAAPAKVAIGQGDPLGAETIHVPRGRGPLLGPTAFEGAAVDALVNCAPYAARLKDWSIARMLTNDRGPSRRSDRSPGRRSRKATTRCFPTTKDHFVAAAESDQMLGPFFGEMEQGCRRIGRHHL
jgi:hypothetical protein